MEVEEGEMGEDDAPAPWWVKTFFPKLGLYLSFKLTTYFVPGKCIQIYSFFFLSSIPIDYNLYRKFWTLQDYFRNPLQCYDKFSWMTFLKVNHFSMKAVENCFLLSDQSKYKSKGLNN